MSWRENIIEIIPDLTEKERTKKLQKILDMLWNYYPECFEDIE